MSGFFSTRTSKSKRLAEYGPGAAEPTPKIEPDDYEVEFIEAIHAHFGNGSDVKRLDKARCKAENLTTNHNRRYGLKWEVEQRDGTTIMLAFALTEFMGRVRLDYIMEMKEPGAGTGRDDFSSTRWVDTFGEFKNNPPAIPFWFLTNLRTYVTP
jgi:hypothetical protein